MFNRCCVVIICIPIIQQMFLANGEMLPAKKVGKGNNKLNNPTTSYYQPNAFGPNTYAFGFEINDKVTGNIQFRDERRYANGTTHGSYGYVRPDGSVMVTHFFADADLGYLSQSRNFEPGEEPVWQVNWPTKKPNKPTENPNDQEGDVNLTSILLPVQPIEEEHGIDLNSPALEKELINPAVLQVIDGEAPLISDAKNNNTSIQLETINKFIPPEFPIVPFQLPNDDLKIKLNEGLSEKPIPVLNKTNANETETLSSKASLKLPEKNSSANENSFNTTAPAKTSKKTELKNSNLDNFAKAEPIITNQAYDWYDKIINQTRQQYLETVN